MISKRLLKVLLLLCFLLLTAWGCSNTESLPAPIPTAFIQPRPTITPSLTATTVPTVTPTPTPNYCPRDTIPANLLDNSSEIDSSKLITFTAGMNGSEDLYVMNLDGSNRTNITNSQYSERFPIWSPDGKKIAFLSNRNDPAKPGSCLNMISNNCVFEIFTSNSNGKHMTQIGHGWNYYPHWSPDSNRVAYSLYFPSPNATPDPNGNRQYLADIYVVNLDGSHRTNLTSKFQPGEFNNPIWSPDSTKLAFVSHTGIVVVNSDGTNPTEYNIPDVRSVLFWSKDNRSILFMNKNYQIIKSNLDFTDLQILRIAFISPDNDIKFSPNGKWFAYKHSYNSTEKNIFCRQIRIASVETFQTYFVYDEQDIATAAGDYFKPIANAIGISSFDWLGNSKLLFSQLANHSVIFTPIEDLFVIDVNGKGLRYITGDVSSFSLQP